MSSSSFPWSHLPTPGRMYGTATVGERGQVSIPVEARKELSIEPGDKVVVFGNRINGAVMLVKADIFEDFAGFFLTKLNKLGEHAHEVFDQFVPGGDGDAADDEPPGDESAKDESPTTRRRRPA